ncbi:MAG: GtrA family protein [Pseudomonadota bacterium]
MTNTELVLRYSLFALISTVVILGTQRISLWIYDGWGGVTVALIIGTGAGLVIKYLLDKKWIFADDRNTVADHTKQFSLYALMGVFTTAVLWTVQYAFWLIWRTEDMFTVGGMVGLAIGYATKYHLDKRFVFNSKPEHSAGSS